MKSELRIMAIFGSCIIASSILGFVIKVLPVEMRDAGIVVKGSFQYEVTPATISVTQVVYGEVPESKEITYLQHGVEDKKTSI